MTAQASTVERNDRRIYQRTCFVLPVLAAMFVLGGAGCTKAAKNPNDMTPPEVVIKVRDASGQYVPTQTAKMDPTIGSLDLVCVVTDLEGVRSAEITFGGTASWCMNSLGDTVSGTFPISGLPAPLPLNLQGDSSGNFLTTAPLYTTFAGPLNCMMGNPSEKGVPFNSEVTVQCSGQNWSSDPQQSGALTKLAVKL